MSPPAATVRTFVPEQWGQLDLFAKFYSGTYELSGDARKALSGISNHFHKASLLLGMARKQIPNLEKDEAQLKATGFTPGINSREFAAIVEGAFVEIYTSVDCARKIIVSTHRHCRRLPDSTRKLMQRVKAGELGADFPEPLKVAILATAWYEELLSIRDALTHSDVGSCRQDPETKLVSYVHHGIRVQDSPLIITDVLMKLEDFMTGVNSYLGAVFAYLNSTLRAHEIDQMCGVFFGRFYMRKLRLDGPIDLNSGICISRSWFLQEAGFRCPLADSCAAFHRVTG